ncbi:group II intron maturase-specific domain-containing protein [Planctellipticum variicoloris]|uniref:group II intron maturase-specific domain-containing protein n=1 Tax=Planctellipticum variicoloris TaxID=3064265 RepID=UPI003AF859F1
MVEDMNQDLRGWVAYFRHGYPAPAFPRVRDWARGRLHQHPAGSADPRALCTGH